MVQPDVIIICDLDEHLADDGYYKGVPTLLVEVLSESTAKLDLIKKYDLYMSCDIPEYWVVDPEEQLIIVHSFQEGTRAKSVTYRPSEKAKSQVFPDLAVDLARVFRYSTAKYVPQPPQEPLVWLILQGQELGSYLGILCPNH